MIYVFVSPILKEFQKKKTNCYLIVLAFLITSVLIIRIIEALFLLIVKVDFDALIVFIDRSKPVWLVHVMQGFVPFLGAIFMPRGFL